MSSFLSGLESVFSKLFSGVRTATSIAQVAEPGLALIPGYGPAIVAGIQMAVLLESAVPSAPSGTPLNNSLNQAKAQLTVPTMVSAQPGITAEQAAAGLAELIKGFNNAAKAMAAAAPVADPAASSVLPGLPVASPA